MPSAKGATNRGIVWLTHYEISQLLDLPPGQQVWTVAADWQRMAIGVIVAGEGLPDVAPGAEAPSVPLAPYVDLQLRAKVRALLDRWQMDRDGNTAADMAQAIEKVLTREMNPLVDMAGDALGVIDTSTPA
jgi:hypothetical protein